MSLGASSRLNVEMAFGSSFAMLDLVEFESEGGCRREDYIMIVGPSSCLRANLLLLPGTLRRVGNVPSVLLSVILSSSSSCLSPTLYPFSRLSQRLRCVDTFCRSR